MNSLIVTFLPVILLCLCNGTLVVLSGKKFGKCIPVSMISVVLILYISQFIFHTFNVGYVLIIIWACAFAILLVMNKRNLPGGGIKSNYFSFGFYTYICAACIFFVLDFHRSFAMWDEFSHWGMMSKELLRLDNWYSIPESRLLIHWDYPPFGSIFEMFWCKLSGNGYNEMGVYIATHMMAIGIMIPPLVDSCDRQELSNKKDGSIKAKYITQAFLLIVIFIVAIKSFDATNRFTSIYKDPLLAFLFAYAMLLITSGDAIKSKFDYIGLVLVCTALLLTKQMGITFVLVIWLYFAVRAIRNTCGKARVFFLIKTLPALVIVPLLVLRSWKNYVKSLGIFGQFELSKISIEEIIGIINDPYGETLTRQTFNSYIHALFEKDVASIFMPLTYVAGLVLVLFSIWLIWRFIKKEEVWNVEEAIELGIVFTCGTAGYALVMAVLYLFCFAEGEMRILASFERYLSSWLLGEVLVVCMVLYRNMRKNNMINIKYLCIGFVACMLLTKTSNLSIFIPGVLDGKPNKASREVANYLEEKINDNGSIFILANDTVGAQYFINFYADNVNIVLCYTDFLNADFQNEEIKANAIEKIFGNDYLYVKNISESFNNGMSYLNNGNLFVEGTLYSIIHENGTISIKEIQ